MTKTRDAKKSGEPWYAAGYREMQAASELPPPEPQGQRERSGLATCFALSAKSKPEKINARLFDLVRYMRAELHEADLITDVEYGWLCSEAALATGAGSPSPRRLEDYDEMRRRLAALEQQNAGDVARAGNGAAPKQPTL